MRTDRCGTASFMPELKALGFRFGDKAFTVTVGADPDDFFGDFIQRFFVIADDVTHQNHLRVFAALAFDRVIDGMQIAVVKVFKPGKHAALRMRIQQFCDFDDGGTGKSCCTEKFKAYGTAAGRHFVQNPGG